ncbi:FAD-dependent monooxygenase [Rhizohabitans arisaemae]|uniref:FAD-dependent monooxygenase n=1 Tax=Rhizohabitans arisaemae TaxID=2720610 RepID=UPI0024B0E5A0|nr:FAD-dependent monooxygenase [Rhizohabitans arisaemae]
MGDRTLVCLGGGPAGLFLARLLRRADPSWQVTVYERDAPGATFGFGIGLADKTLESLARLDPDTRRRITEAGVVGDGIHLRHRGTALRWGPRGGTAIARAALLNILREQALEAGAVLRHGTAVEPGAVPAADVVVAADGANSATRAALSRELGVEEGLGRAKYIWLGAELDLPGMTFSFVSDENGSWAAHAYPYAPGMATFLVETDERTWRRAGLDRPGAPLSPDGTDLRSKEYLERLFAADLDGRPLLGNRSRWANFRNVRCATWSSGNTVLVGDAAHTAHFSIGSGTTLAMEDAVSLARCLAEHPEPAVAFDRYEAERRPAVEHLQSRAMASQIWWETFDRRMDRDPSQIAFQWLTRTGALSYDRLRAADPRLAREIENWFADATAAQSRLTLDAGADPICTPVRVAGTALPTRVVVTRPPSHSDVEARRERDLALFGGLALAGAGLVVADLTAVPADPPDWTELAGLADFIAAHSHAVPGVRLTPDPVQAKAAAEAGFGYLEFAGGALADLASAVGSVGAPLRAATLIADPASALTGGRMLRDAGADVVRLVHEGGRAPDLALYALAEEVRAETGLAVLVGDGSARTEQLRTAVVAGQADLTECWPVVPAGSRNPS